MHVTGFTQDSKLEAILTKLVDHFQPVKAFLFGSRSKGTGNAESDYDIFLIVKSSSKSQLERMDEANFVLWGRDVPVDVLIYTEEEFERSKDSINSISHIVASEGRELNDLTLYSDGPRQWDNLLCQRSRQKYYRRRWCCQYC